MNRIDAYIDAVLSHLPPTQEDLDRIAGDLRAHLEASVEAGIGVEEAIRRMGPPRDVASSFFREQDMVYASPWLRLGAALVDYPAIIAVSFVLLLFVGSNATSGPRMLMSMAAVGFLPTAYFVIAESITGRTVGKWAFGIETTGAFGGQPGFIAAFIRRLSLVIPPIFMIDAAVLLFNPKRQRALDMLAGTVVIRSSPAPSMLTRALAVLLSFALTAGVLAAMNLWFF